MAQNTPDAWGGNHYLSCQARCRLDARLWLTCRLALAKGLLEEDSGIGKLAGSARSVTAAIGSCLHHCQQGLDEADAFGDLELAAEFAFVTVVHTLQQGKISDELLDKLEVALAHWLTYWSYFSMDWSMIDRWIHWLIGWLIYWLLIDWVIDWLTDCWFIHRWIHWLIGWLIDWLLIDCVIDWLSDW